MAQLPRPLQEWAATSMHAAASSTQEHDGLGVADVMQYRVAAHQVCSVGLEYRVRLLGRLHVKDACGATLQAQKQASVLGDTQSACCRQSGATWAQTRLGGQSASDAQIEP